MAASTTQTVPQSAFKKIITENLTWILRRLCSPAVCHLCWTTAELPASNHSKTDMQPSPGSFMEWKTCYCWHFLKSNKTHGPLIFFGGVAACAKPIFGQVLILQTQEWIEKQRINCQECVVYPTHSDVSSLLNSASLIYQQQLLL